MRERLLLLVHQDVFPKVDDKIEPTCYLISSHMKTLSGKVGWALLLTILHIFQIGPIWFASGALSPA